MPSNTSASVFGGAGGRGSRASVSSPQGLRTLLRKDERDQADEAEPAKTPPPPGVPDGPRDDKHTLRGLNGRLSDYLGKVKRLEKENADLEREIDQLLEKRRTPEGRDWDQTEKPLEDLKKQVSLDLTSQTNVTSEVAFYDVSCSVQVKDVTMDNARLLLQIDNTNLAQEDFKNKYASLKTVDGCQSPGLM